MKFKILIGVFALISPLIVATPAHAYCHFGPTWSNPSSTKYLAMYSPNIPTSMRPAIAAANMQFDQTSNSALNISGVAYYSSASSFDLQPFQLSRSNPGTYQGIVLMPNDIPGVAWRGSYLPWPPSGGNHAKIYLNPLWTWSTYFNQQSRIADTQSVVIHELGHAHGLAHPSDSIHCADGGSMTTSEIDGVMNVQFINKRTLRSDDLSGLAYLY